MSKSRVIVVWFRSDLRINDHPALSAAIADSAFVVPVFVLDNAILNGKFSSPNRNRFLLESLQDLKKSLQGCGADLVVRDGDPESQLAAVIEETGADGVYYTADYSPRAIKRDKHLSETFEKKNIEFRAFGGRLAINGVQKLQTKAGEPYKVFTPFWRAWSEVGRRPLAAKPKAIRMPKVKVGKLPSLTSLVADKDYLSKDALKGGETEARKRLEWFLAGPIDSYHEVHNDMAEDATSRLSSYLHLGCISVREIETMLPDSQGARSWHRQLAWRDFYHYVLLNHPYPEREFQERYRNMSWGGDAKLLEAWKQGETGYPAVDAAMRQLKSEGWMHNRARLIVGSFLTKDLDIDWRDGERHFMQWLIDGDMANNNGNWQWIASVGVDPAPAFRRMYNPSTQRDKYDPSGRYVRKYVPQLRNVPDKYLSQPWTMPEDVQKEVGCIIGKDYPAPIVDHAAARNAALEKYRSM